MSKHQTAIRALEERVRALDQLSIPRFDVTTEESAARHAEEAKQIRAAIEALAEQQWEPVSCDMGEMCLDCTPRSTDGSCPGQKPNGACDCYVNGFNDGMKELEQPTLTGLHPAEQLAAAQLQDQQRIAGLTAINNSNHNYITKLHERIAELEKELDEQCRLHGMGSEREASQLGRIAELEANLKRATAALKAQQLETTCECKNCMNATEAIESAIMP